MITPTQSCLVLFYCAIFKRRNVDIIVFGENYTFSDEVDFIDDKVDMRKIPKILNTYQNNHFNVIGFFIFANIKVKVSTCYVKYLKSILTVSEGQISIVDRSLNERTGKMY